MRRGSVRPAAICGLGLLAVGLLAWGCGSPIVAPSVSSGQTPSSLESSSPPGATPRAPSAGATPIPAWMTLPRVPGTPGTPPRTPT